MAEMRAAALEEEAKVCERAVATFNLPDAPQYEGDQRPVERPIAIALAAAIRALKREADQR